MNYVNYLHMHLHGHAFVNIAITASSIISEYIWLFLCCSIGKKYEVKRAVFSSQIYHLPAMTGYINMPFILDPRGDLITTQTYTEQSQGNPKKKKKKLSVDKHDVWSDFYSFDDENNSNNHLSNICHTTWN